MAKEANITEIVQTLQEAQQNKELLGALTSSLERYVEQQKKGLEELETLVAKAKDGKLTVKKRGGYRGRKSKNVENTGAAE
ncbi:hypothetical protein [Adhaeribacter pallidiroseus]|uniref:Uncharacterized protein n=1 Tax=Adhaeribacter pallidiroseus TaxID=2072847 RepID=A0A369QD39_9BACT|nr:hypothetical protein [Adhaeribacter pallidiroseus]RDC62342.1 hypothetical protein AHMF7616_00935 [Adhaeribacter pallidiroseus]